MSIPSSNFYNYNYNIDKLNFSKIKKELDTIPKIIKNHNKLRPCLSMADINNNDKINISNNLNEDLFIKNLDYNQNKNNITLSYKNSSSIKNFKNFYKNRNDTNNSLIDESIIKIKKENKKEINNIKSLYERKIQEITLTYENKFINLNKLLQNNLDEYKLLSTDYISITKHKSIINELKQSYNELLDKTKENYEKLLNKLTDIMKNKTKYQDLIQRLQFYSIYEIEINEIEQKLINNLNEKLNNKLQEQNKGNNPLFNDFYLISQLDEDINYHKKIFELKQIYQEKLTKLKITQNNKINNLINQVKYVYDNYSNFSSEQFLSNNPIINNKDLSEDIKIKKIIKEKKNTNEIINISEYKENECKSFSNSERNSDNNQNSSIELANMLNIDSSQEKHMKPEVMEINFKNHH